jgi:hydrogenase/urease accessory protein HupE
MRFLLLSLTLTAMLISPAFAHRGPDHAHSLADGILHPLTGADHSAILGDGGLP